MSTLQSLGRRLVSAARAALRMSASLSRGVSGLAINSPRATQLHFRESYASALDGIRSFPDINHFRTERSRLISGIEPDAAARWKRTSTEVALGPPQPAFFEGRRHCVELSECGSKIINDFARDDLRCRQVVQI